MFVEIMESKGFLTLGPFGPKGYCLSLRAPPLPHTSFWLLHQHSGTDWIYTNIQPLQFFLPRVKGQGQPFEKILVLSNLISPIFLCEVTHEHWDNLIRFSAFQR